MVLIVLVAVLGVGSYLIIGGTPGNGGEVSDNYFFSFEDGLQNWENRGTDLDDPPVEWSIDVSQELASHGGSSARFYLSNVNDAGKIWLERSFDVDPNTSYRVDVSYDFASADYGDINLWRVITGVHRTSPGNAGDLVFQGDTGNGADSDVGYKWVNKNYDFTIESGSGGKIYVTLGVWGTWETDRTYFVDNVRIEFEKINEDEVVTEEESKEIAREFVENSPTYKFDGFDLEHVETLYPDLVDCPYCWTFVFEFKSRHAGYGDRTGENLLQVITPHEAHVTVKNGKVTNAVLDLKWDMINQEFLDSPTGLLQGTHVFDHSGIDGSIIENGLFFDLDNLQRRNYLTLISSENESGKFDYSLLDLETRSFIDETDFSKSSILVFQRFPASTEPDYEIKSIERVGGELRLILKRSSDIGTDDITVETLFVRLSSEVETEFQRISVVTPDNQEVSL